MVPGEVLNAVWHIKSRDINEVVRAEDQFEAWDTLRDRSLYDFGLIVTAERDEDADPIPVHTSALLTWWGRQADAAQIRGLAITNGLPDTFDSDYAFAAKRASNSHSQDAVPVTGCDLSTREASDVGNESGTGAAETFTSHSQGEQQVTLAVTPEDRETIQLELAQEKRKLTDLLMAPALPNERARARKTEAVRLCLETVARLEGLLADE